MILKTLIIFLLSLSCFAQNEATGVNLTLDEGFGARQFALGNTFLGMRGDGTFLSSHPAGINDAEQLEVTLGHTRKFILSSYDDFSAVLPIDEGNTLAFGLSRFGGESELRYDDPNSRGSTLNVSDYLIVSAFAKRWGNLNAGVNLSLLYREYDQKGLGIRSDLSAQYTFQNKYILSALYKGLIPSTARWESEHLEYQPSDLFMGGGVLLPSKYFYGEFNLAYQTEGLFQKHAKSKTVTSGSRLYENPGDALINGNLGLEYSSFTGLALRFGTSEFRRAFYRMSPSFGISYNYKKVVTLDYSFQSHVELGGAHRISFTIDPFFGRSSAFPKRYRAHHQGKSAKSLNKINQKVLNNETSPSVKGNDTGSDGKEKGNSGKPVNTRDSEGVGSKKRGVNGESSDEVMEESEKTLEEELEQEELEPEVME